MPRFDLGVRPVVGEAGRFHVESSRRGGLVYLVDLQEYGGNGWCGCCHFEFRSRVALSPVQDCKHIRQAQSYQRLQAVFTQARRRAQ